MSWKCPQCNEMNDDSSVRCVCGYDIESNRGRETLGGEQTSKMGGEAVAHGVASGSLNNRAFSKINASLSKYLYPDLLHLEIKVPESDLASVGRFLFKGFLWLIAMFLGIVVSVLVVKEMGERMAATAFFMFIIYLFLRVVFSRVVSSQRIWNWKVQHLKNVQIDENKLKVWTINGEFTFEFAQENQKSICFISDWFNQTKKETSTKMLCFAGFWRRFIALFVDFILIYLVSRPFVFVFTTTKEKPMEVLVFILFMVFCWLYFALFEASAKQGTVGKMIIGIKVTDKHGQRISFGKASGRFFAKSLSVMTFCLGFLMAGWTLQKQALHDMAFDTLVLRNKL